MHDEIDAPTPRTASPMVPLDDMPRTPSGRIPQWMLDESAGRRVEPTAWRSTARPLDETVFSSTRGRREPTRTRRPMVAAIALAVLVAGSWGLRWWQSDRGVGTAHLPGSAALGQPLAGDLATASGNRLANGPTPGFEEADAPLGTPPNLVPDGAPHAFMSTQITSAGATVPVSWSPCRPIHVVVNTASAPDTFVPEVKVVMGEITRATGLQLTYDGLTDEPATQNRQPYQLDRYGDRWAPVIIGFTDEEHVPALVGRVAGVAQPMRLTRSDLDYSVITTASLWLDDTLLTEPATRNGPAWLPVLRHEFGHVVGLGHVNDPTELMNPMTVPGIDTYQSGDLYGLAELGKGRCTSDF